MQMQSMLLKLSYPRHNPNDISSSWPHCDGRQVGGGLVLAKRMDHGDEREHGRGDDSCHSATCGFLDSINRDIRFGMYALDGKAKT